MAWSAPMTAVAGSVFTAAQFNQYVRDNLLQTAPALATAAGQMFVSTGPNALAARTPTSAAVDTSQTTTSTSFADLTTPGPSVTVTTGTAALVALYANTQNSGTSSSVMGYTVSGASSIAASIPKSIGGNFGSSSSAFVGGVFMETGLTAGSNTFKAQYLVGGSTGTFQYRKIAVLPL